MASTIDFVNFVIETLGNIGELRSRKMFGEYMIYLNDRLIITICDNIAFVKIDPRVKTLLPDAKTGIPYPGARERYILDFDQPEIAQKVALLLADITPLPRKKSPQTKKS